MYNLKIHYYVSQLNEKSDSLMQLFICILDFIFHKITFRKMNKNYLISRVDVADHNK